MASKASMSKLRLSSAITTPRADQLAAKIFDAIVAGEFPADSQLPPETRLAETAGVSRLTTREAIKSLIAKNVVRIERGRGTFVNASSSWASFDPALLVAHLSTGSVEHRERAILSLLETRRYIEVGAAELCSTRCTPEEIKELHHHLDEMRRHCDESERETEHVKAFAAADLAFHRTILNGTRNQFLVSLLQPIEEAVALARELTSMHPAARNRAVDDHETILKALESGDASSAARAMRMHIDHTIKDVVKLPLSEPVG